MEAHGGAHGARSSARDEPISPRGVGARRSGAFFFESHRRGLQGRDRAPTCPKARPGNASTGRGGWIDLCRGPHLPSTGQAGPRAFKLTRLAGRLLARRFSRNAMLQRVYGTAWLDRRPGLETSIWRRLEEAERRDHRRLGPPDGPVPLPGRGGGRRAFWHRPAAGRLYRTVRGLHAPPAQDAGGLPGGQHRRTDGLAQPVGGVRPLGQVRREHVHQPAPRTSASGP